MEAMMDISLRKAAALQLAINEALKLLRLSHGVTVSIYEEDPEGRVAAEAAGWTAALARRGSLLGALYQIRTRVGAANQAAGVDDRLAELARLEREVQFYTPLSQAEPREAPEILRARIQRLRTREEAPVGRFGGSQPLPETVQVGLFGQVEIDGFRSELRRLTRTRQQLKDELLELNAGTRISLAPETVATLQREELI
jgi:hypothetical protein